MKPRDMAKEDSPERTERALAFIRHAIDYMEWERDYLEGTWEQIENVLAPALGGTLVMIANMRYHGMSKEEIVTEWSRMWREV